MKRNINLTCLTIALGCQHGLCAAQPIGGRQVTADGAATVTEAHLVRDIILCDGPVWPYIIVRGTSTSSSPKAQEYLKAYESLIKKWEPRNDQGGVSVSHTISSVQFTHLTHIMVQGFAGTVSYSPTASLDGMRKMLEATGAVMQAGPKVSLRSDTGPEWRAVRTAGEVTIVYGVTEGPWSPTERPKTRDTDPKGLTLTCTVRAASVEEEQAQGIIGVGQAASALPTSAAPSPQWFDELLSRGTLEAKVMAAQHKHLELEQTQKLLESGEPRLAIAVVQNTAVDLTASQIDFLIESRKADVIDALVRRYHARFTPQQRERLALDPRWKSALLLLAGGAPAAQELRRLYRESSRLDVALALSLLQIWKFSPEKLPIIDVIIEHGSPQDRRLMASYGGIMYTPEQIRTLLLDKDIEVRIYVLRRKDLVIDAELVRQGLSESDPDLISWYSSRTEAQADSAQIESQLTSTHGPTRAGAVFDKRNSLSAEQIARALKDPYTAVVSGVLSRHDLRLSEQQLDDCARHADPGIRFACVRRPDFTATYGRWLIMLMDSNPNTWSDHVRAHPQTPMLTDEYLGMALQTASENQLVLIAQNKGVKWTAAQLENASTHPSQAVRSAFCARTTKRPC